MLFVTEGNAQQFNGREGETATLLSRCLFNSELRGGGFAPRHLNRSASSLVFRGFKMKNILLGIFTITIFFGANKVYAQCFCGNAGESAFEELKRSDTVFVGEVIQVEKVESTKKLEYEEFNVTFKVKTAWKTNLPETITIKNINSNGSNFKEKESYLVYAKIYENSLSAYIGCCTRTTLLSKATKYLEEFEKDGEKPHDIVEKPKPK